MASPDVTVFVCVTCRGQEQEAVPRGRRLFEAVTGMAGAAVSVVPVECLAVCKRPCTVALSAPGKWSCVVGDLDPDRHAEDVLVAARSFSISVTGIIPWRERPLSFRKGVVARVPPV